MPRNNVERQTPRRLIVLNMLIMLSIPTINESTKNEKNKANKDIFEIISFADVENLRLVLNIPFLYQQYQNYFLEQDQSSVMSRAAEMFLIIHYYSHVLNNQTTILNITDNMENYEIRYFVSRLLDAGGYQKAALQILFNSQQITQEMRSLNLEHEVDFLETARKHEFVRSTEIDVTHPKIELLNPNVQPININILDEQIPAKREGKKYHFYSYTSLLDIPSIEKYINKNKPLDFLELAIEFFSSKNINPNNIFDKDTKSTTEYRYEVAKAFYEIGLNTISLQILSNLENIDTLKPERVFSPKSKKTALVIAEAAEKSLTAHLESPVAEKGILTKFFSSIAQALRNFSSSPSRHTIDPP